MYNIFLNMIKDKKLLAHINMDKRETLKEHTLLTEEYYKKIVEEKNLENIINNLCSFFKCSDFIKDMFKNAIIFHDLGKVNPSFQCIKLNNKISSFINDSKYNSNHSLLSAYIYISKYFDYIDKTYPRDKDRQINKRNKSTRIYLKSIVCTFGFLISKHHSFLNNELFNADLNNLTFIDKINELNTCIQVDNYYLSAINEDLDLNILQVKNINNSIEFMVLCKILYILLLFKKALINKDFYSYYKSVLLEIEQRRSLINTENYQMFLNEIDNLLFLSIEKRMQLIEHNTISIYIPHTKIKGINGYSLWEEYSQIISSTKLDFATKKVLISRLSKNMNIFVFNIFNNKKFKLDTIECVNGIYYLKNGEDFITNEGKLNREGLEEYLLK